jgi:hypothetical protein
LAPLPVTDPSRRAYITTAFEQAISRFPSDNDLKLNFIDFVAESKPREAKKLCKAMLKAAENRNNLVLLDRYAQLEAAAGKVGDAMKVYTTALSMAKALPLEELRPVTLTLTLTLPLPSNPHPEPANPYSHPTPSRRRYNRALSRFEAKHVVFDRCGPESQAHRARVWI